MVVLVGCRVGIQVCFGGLLVQRGTGGGIFGKFCWNLGEKVGFSFGGGAKPGARTKARGTKIHEFSMKIDAFEQNDGFLRLLDGPRGVYGGTCGVQGGYIGRLRGFVWLGKHRRMNLWKVLSKSVRKIWIFHWWIWENSRQDKGPGMSGAPKSMDFE